MGIQYNDINGHEHPILKIYDLNDVLVDTLNFPDCGRNGVQESYSFPTITHQLCDLSEIVEYQNGCHINFALDYTEYADRNDTDIFEYYLNYMIQNSQYKFVLIPASDYMYRKFEVNPKNIDLTIKNLLLQGTEGIELQFRTTELQTEINWINPDKVIYHGTYIYPYTGILEVA